MGGEGCEQGRGGGFRLVLMSCPCRYYSIYDSGDRQGLLDAYHDGACCSLSIPFFPQNPSRCDQGPGRGGQGVLLKPRQAGSPCSREVEAGGCGLLGSLKL